MKNNAVKYIKAFNHEDVCLVISDYPEDSNAGRKNYGIAWYTKKILSQFAKRYDKRFIVLGEKTDVNEPQTYFQNRILVLRVFDQKHPTLFPRILRWLFTFNKVSEVHVHSEFCANGGLINTALLLPFLFLIKLTGRKITYFAHNVVTDLTPLSRHLNITSDVALFVLNRALRWYYRVLGLIVDRVVVLDELVKKRILLFVNKKKVVNLPFWVERKISSVTKQKARANLAITSHDFVLLYFGFVTHYKGADWLIHTIKSLQEKKQFKRLRLILAGGEAYSLKDKDHYQRFYKQLVESVEDERKIQITGFVPDEKIVQYFKAADLVVFPYRGIIGSSGALNHALTYRKPFILSKTMQELISQNTDFLHILQREKLEIDDMTFSAEKLESLEEILKRAITSKTFLKKLHNVSFRLAKERSLSKCVYEYYHKLFEYETSSKGKIPALKLSFRSA